MKFVMGGFNEGSCRHVALNVKEKCPLVNINSPSPQSLQKFLVKCVGQVHTNQCFTNSHHIMFLYIHLNIFIQWPYPNITSFFFGVYINFLKPTKQ